MNPEIIRKMQRLLREGKEMKDLLKNARALAE